MALINGSILNDTITPGFVSIFVIGGPATAAPDTINGLAGNDSIDGGGGGDFLFGNDGNDTILGGVGLVIAGALDDQIFGGIGNDILNGQAGNDLLIGEAGVDQLFGGDNDDTLVGGADGDFFDGGNGNDLLDGGTGNDLLDGGAGNDTATYANAAGAVVASLDNPAVNTGEALSDRYDSVENLTGSGFGDTLTGNLGNNRLNGGNGDDVLIGTGGNDLLDGGTGFDTADYGSLGGAITLLSEGVIAKGAFGQDTITGIERIVGDAAFANLIDGQVAGPQATRFEVDLGSEVLIVRDIPGLGDVKFNVVNFRDVRGTANDDTITGDAQGNTFLGTAGKDLYDGADGFDSIDYSSLGAAVTLLSQGVVEKAGIGTDTITNMERIVGDAGFANLIDGQVAGPQVTRFEVDLGSEVLIIRVIPGLGDVKFNVVNFRDVRGTANDDTIAGDAQDNSFLGSNGKDLYDGADGFDSIDYTGLGAEITLLSQGVIEKAGIGTDVIANMERIVADTGLANLIDGQIAGPQLTRFDIDLSANRLDVLDVPFLGTASFVVENFRDVRGTANDDTIIGDAQDNSFLGTTGNDIYDGLSGFDTIDYTGLGAQITLLSQGVIEKAGIGTDVIAGMERIVGDAGFANLIDGQVAGPQVTRFDIDLSANRLDVLDVPGFGTTSFVVENFRDVRGTANDDTIIGDTQDNSFLVSAGSDLYDGADGFDTIDYTGLGAAVTLLSQGVIEKAGIGTDVIAGMERIVGDAGFANLIDGQVAGPQTTSFLVNLSTNRLDVVGVPSLGTASFVVENFRDVRGTANDDTIAGDAQDNTFLGTTGNDHYTGGVTGGFDTIDYTGVAPIVFQVTFPVGGLPISRILKDGLGIDRVLVPDRVVGDAAFVNRIDGQNAASFIIDLDLAAQQVTVRPSFGGGSLT